MLHNLLFEPLFILGLFSSIRVAHTRTVLQPQMCQHCSSLSTALLNQVLSQRASAAPDAPEPGAACTKPCSSELTAETRVVPRAAAERRIACMHA